MTAHRLPQHNRGFVERLTEPSIVFSAVALVIAVALKTYGPDLSLDVIAHALATYLWDLLVLVVPSSALGRLDQWLCDSTATNPMYEYPQTHAAKSEVLRRVMGLESSGGLMASIFQARTRALSVTGSVLGLKLDPSRPAGLGNRDNSCYQNSILQGLSALPSFPEYLSACIRTVESQTSGKDVARTLQSLISDLNDTSNNGKTIWTPTLLKSMSTWTQQDAQEYYSKVLDDIDKSVAAAVKAMRRYQGLEADCGSKDDTTASEHSDDSGYQSLSSGPDLAAKKDLRNPLEGLLAQRVACIECGFSEGLSLIPFNCLTLSLGLDNEQHDLYERLDSYSKVESIEGVECPKCTLLKAKRLLSKLVERFKENNSSEDQLAEPLRRLEAVELALEEDDFSEKTVAEECKISSQGKVSTTKTKQIVIARPPQSLCVHINRSVFDPRTFDMIKNSAPVSFPFTLDLGPWCLGSADDLKEKMTGTVEQGEEQWLLSPESSMIAGDMEPSRLTGPIYELRAAVTHYGRHENGHYICYRRYPRSQEGGDASESPVSAVDDSIDGDEANPSEKAELPPVLGINDGWWRLSDHNVSKVSEETVLSLSPGVFMLFYECIDSTMVLQSEADDLEDAPSAEQISAAVNGLPEAERGPMKEGTSLSQSTSQEDELHCENMSRDRRMDTSTPSLDSSNLHSDHPEPELHRAEYKSETEGGNAELEGSS